MFSVSHLMLTLLNFVVALCNLWLLDNWLAAIALMSNLAISWWLLALAYKPQPNKQSKTPYIDSVLGSE